MNCNFRLAIVIVYGLKVIIFIIVTRNGLDNFNPSSHLSKRS